MQVLGRFVKPGPDCGWTRTGEETAVPTRIEAEVYLAEPLVKLRLHVTVDWAGRGLVRELTVVTDGPQTGVSINLLRRIPVEKVMRFVMSESTVPIVMRPDIGPRAFQVPGDTGDGAWISGGPIEPGRGKNAPADRVARAADAYRQALASGSKAPGEAVAEALGYSRATAARDIREARKRGLLPPKGKDALEADPTAAITGTGRVERMSAEDYNRALEELGLQGEGVKGKRFSEMTPGEFHEIVSSARAKHPGVPFDDGREAFLDEQRRLGNQVVENRRPADDSGPL